MIKSPGSSRHKDGIHIRLAERKLVTSTLRDLLIFGLPVYLSLLRARKSPAWLFLAPVNKVDSEGRETAACGLDRSQDSYFSESWRTTLFSYDMICGSKWQDGALCRYYSFRIGFLISVASYP
jgi:hypothetical protein